MVCAAYIHPLISCGIIPKSRPPLQILPPSAGDRLHRVDWQTDRKDGADHQNDRREGKTETPRTNPRVGHRTPDSHFRQSEKGMASSITNSVLTSWKEFYSTVNRII